ncbi:MAG TPA: hypothetical protein VM553_15620 [Dongiaceae bacterium]|nr:hypothetical protein [Dongiaceae bacterium]
MAEDNSLRLNAPFGKATANSKFSNIMVSSTQEMQSHSEMRMDSLSLATHMPVDCRRKPRRPKQEAICKIRPTTPFSSRLL